MKQNKSIIDRYFDYMRDSWCEEECRTIFGTRAASVWKVWCRSIAPDLCGAARRFYIALDRGNRRLLIEHIACAVRGQDEECLSKEPSVLVCQECGSREIQMMAWVDPNTLEYVSSIDADADDQWCDACQEHIWFCSLEEFGDNLDAWWLAVDFPKWNGLRDCLRRIIRRMTRDKRSSMPATLGGKPSTMNENGLSGWRTTRVGRSGKTKTKTRCNQVQ